MLNPLRSIALCLSLTFAAAGLIGCGGSLPTPGPELESALTRPAGCGDVFMYTSNSEDTLAVSFQSMGQVAYARSVGTTTTFPFSLPGADMKLKLYQGRRLTQNNCNDVIVPGSEQVIEIERTAVSGSAKLVIDPSSGAQSEKGTLTLTDIVFQDQTGGAASVTLPHLELKNVVVGWFAG